MRIISELIRRNYFIVFGFAIFLIRIPPLHFLTDSPLFSSFNVAGYLLAALLAIRIWEGIRTGKKLFFQNVALFPVFLFFVSQSLSAITAVNTEEFITSYKDLVFAIILFMVAVDVVDSKKKFHQVIGVIFFSMVVNLVIQSVLYFQPAFLNILAMFFTEGYLQDFEINAGRDRYFVESHNVALIPILFIFLAKASSYYKKLGIGMTALFIGAFSFLSNFRAQLVILFISLFAGGKFYFRKAPVFFRYAAVIMAILFIVNGVTSIGLGYNALDRLISPSINDYDTITDRFYYWNLAVEMGMSSPIFGVGLGNFFDYLPGNKNTGISVFDARNNFFKITWVHPHNIFFGIFAETGFFGLISFIILLTSFVKMDLKSLLVRKNMTINLLVTSFWLVFSYALINPPISFSYLGLFWLIRGLIYVLIARKNIAP
jgi:O-antigen ligase